MDRIEWVGERCRLLRAIGDELERTQPFAGLTIGTGIHLEPKTVALILTLRRGGAALVSTGNLNTTQQEACDYLADRGVHVVGGPTSDPSEHDRHLWEVVRTQPDLLLDNGGDLFVRYLEEPWDRLRGGTEETTSAPPAASVRSSATVFGSRWMPVPMRSPAYGRVRSNSSRI